MELFNVIAGDQPKTIFFNFLSIGALIVVIFSVLIGLFLLTLKNKSRSTTYLGLTFVTTGLFNVGYIVAQMYYDPSAAFHRWGTVSFVLIVIGFMTQFVFYFPANTNRKVSRIWGTIQYVLTASLSIWFCAVTFNEEKVFFFTGHYWDFKAKVPSLVIAAAIGSYVLAFAAVSTWKALKLKGMERWSLTAMAVGFLIAAVLPVITNLLSRDGAIDRGIHQTVAVLSFVLGLFVIVIVYINSTKDTTSFMAKIVGITLVTMLLLIQMLSFISLRDREVAFDALKKEQVARAVETRRLGESARYSVGLKSGIAPMTFARKPVHPINFRTYRSEFFNTSAYERIKAAAGSDAEAKIDEILKSGGANFAGYRASIRKYIDSRSPQDEGDLVTGIDQAHPKA